MKKYLLLIASFILTLQIKAQTVSDVDGNTYNTVTIGTQVWMKENLKTTKYNDGTAIPNVTDNAAWIALTTPAYCWYNNDAATYKTTYGALYNWYTVNTGKLCPTEWHVPSDADWTTLITFLGNDNIAENKLKETGYTHWSELNTDATNSSGFTALPGGTRYNTDGNYGILGLGGYWWSATAFNANNANALLLGAGSNELHYWETPINTANSVRCIKDGAVTSAPIIGGQGSNYFYPNPATDKLYLDNNRLYNALVVIFDLQGKQIINIQTGINPIDISGLHNGVYIVKIIDSGKTMISKLVKE